METSDCLMIALGVGVVVFLLTVFFVARHTVGMTFILTFILIILGAVLALNFGGSFNHSKPSPTEPLTTSPPASDH